MTPLHDFAEKYLNLRATQLAALADSAAARGDQELADLYPGEAQRTVDVLQPEYLRVVVDGIRSVLRPPSFVRATRSEGRSARGW